MGMITVYDANGIRYDIPEGTRVNLNGLDIIGDTTTDWNEPIQKNLVELSNRIDNFLIEAKEYSDSMKLSLDADIASKQSALIAGSNVDIVNETISVDLDWNNVINKPSFDTSFLKEVDFTNADISALIQ